MKLQEGSYENIITNELQQNMLQAERENLVCKQEKIDDAESPFMLAEHVNKIILNRLSDENLSTEERVDFVNRLIDFLDEDKEEKVVDDKQMLSAVVQKTEEARLKATKQDIVRPLSCFRKSSLFTGGQRMVQQNRSRERNRERRQANNGEILVTVRKVAERNQQ